MRDIEMGSQAPIDSSDLGLEGFSEEVDFPVDCNQVKIKVSILCQAQEIEMLIDRLSKQLKKLKEANEESKVVSAAVEAIKQHIRNDISEVGKIEQNMKEEIEELKKYNLAKKQEHGCAIGTRVDCVLKKKFKDIMSEFQTIDCMMNTGDEELERSIHEQDWGQVIDISSEIHERQEKMERIKLPAPQGPCSVDNKSTTTQIFMSEDEELLLIQLRNSFYIPCLIFLVIVIFCRLFGYV